MTGIGIDNFARAEGTISERAREWTPGMPGVRWTAAHNSYIQVAAELGLPGFILFSALALGGIAGATRRWSRLPGHWRNGPAEDRFLYLAPMYLAVAFIGFAVTAFFLSFAYVALIYILAAYLSGLYVCLGNRLSAEGMRRHRGEGTRGWVAAARAGV